MSEEAQSQAPVAVGDVLAGKYRVERVLGNGAMGVVVAAMHIHLDERVALKFIHKELLENKEVEARFMREAQSAVRIKGEHVCKVTDVGKLETGEPYMVMEYLTGSDLGAYLETVAEVEVSLAVDFIIQACDALAEAHALSIVHRDLKPTNLFLSSRPDGSPLVKVLDFGVAKVLSKDPKQAPLTAAGAILGSPLYMSPEQILGKPMDARSDIWQLGVILYELLTKKTPFDGTSLTDIIVAIGTKPPPSILALRPNVPRELEQVVMRCLEKDVAKRTPDVAALAEALLPFAATRRAQVNVENIVTMMRGAAYAASLPPMRQPLRSGANLLGANASDPNIRMSPAEAAAAGAFAATMAAPTGSNPAFTPPVVAPVAPTAQAVAPAGGPNRMAETVPSSLRHGAAGVEVAGAVAAAAPAAARPKAQVSTLKWVLIGGATAVVGTVLTVVALHALTPPSVSSAAASARPTDAGSPPRNGAGTPR